MFPFNNCLEKNPQIRLHFKFHATVSSLPEQNDPRFADAARLEEIRGHLTHE